MRCPACKAENNVTDQCRRCKADLTLLMALERRRNHELDKARRHLALGNGLGAVSAAIAADYLRSDADSQRLRTLAWLFAGEFERTWLEYNRSRDVADTEESPGTAVPGLSNGELCR